MGSSVESGREAIMEWNRGIRMIALFLITFFSAEMIAAEPSEKLVPFAALVGPRWVGAFPGGAMTDEQQFEWVFGGRFLRNTHQVRNEKGTVIYEGETIYAWDPKQEQLVWWYWNATGGFITGTLERRGDAWLAEGVNHGPAGQASAVRSEMRISGDSWESVSYFSQDGGWKERFRMKFRKAGH
ncbi:MAG TPA: hypothetical protein VMT00_09965 [Thermoanaerobaculia bacterium]|nr:hypothetical protein [Thermoanaerobaculia bacterium]